MKFYAVRLKFHPNAKRSCPQLELPTFIKISYNIKVARESRSNFNSIEIWQYVHLTCRSILSCIYHPNKL